MKSLLSFRLILVSLFILSVVDLGAQSIRSLRLEVSNKIDPALHHAIAQKEAFPDRPVSNVESYAPGIRADKSAGEVIGILIQSQTDVNDFVRSLGGIIGSRHGDIYTALVPVSAIVPLASDSRVRYLEASRYLFNSLDLSRAKTGADVLHAIVDTTKRLTGKGVILGFTDSGINTQHPNFKSPDGKTRILYIWDQNATSGGVPPGGYNYGIEKTSADIDAGIYTMSDGGQHGTHTSGIAGGNGLPLKQYIGMAPEANFIMVANKGDDLFNRGMTTVGTLDGYDYIRTKAIALGKRFVINTSQGTNLGPHDGTTLFEKALNADVAAGNIICLAAGNEAISARHASAVVTTGSSKEIECEISNSNISIPMDIWYEKNDRMVFEIKQANSGSYISLQPKDTTFTINFDSVDVTITSKLNSPLNGDNELYITFYSKFSFTKRMKLRFSAASGNLLPGGGRVDLWWERNYSVKFVTNVDQSMTFGMPAGADSAITVASYNNRSGSVGSVDDISTFSGRGPRRDGKMKPDISAIGGMVMSSVGSSGYTTNSGTSMSSPHVAGAVALLLQQNPTLTNYQVKQKLLNAATADVLTGAIPNAGWGYGKLNIFKAAGFKGIAIIKTSPDTVFFGSAFINQKKTDSIVVSNQGNEALNVSNVTSNNTIFTVGKTSFTIPPKSSEKLFVSVTTKDTGLFSGALTITSDDSTRPTVSIHLRGRGDFTPIATFSPDSLSLTVNEGDSVKGTMQIGNTGQGPLTYEIGIDYSYGPIVEGSIPQKQSLYNWNKESSSIRSSRKAALVYKTNALLPLIIKDPIGDGPEVDISELRGQGAGGKLSLQLVLNTPLVTSSYGGYIGLDIDQNKNTGVKFPYQGNTQDVGCEYYLTFFNVSTNGINLYRLDSIGGVLVKTYTPTIDVAGNNFMFSIPLTDLKNDDGLMDIALNSGIQGPSEFVPDAGHGSTGGAWLSINPPSGKISPNTSTNIIATAKTGDLDGGKFYANIVISTNDPIKKIKTIPFRLTVVGAPNLVSPDSVIFKTVYVGFPDTMNVALGNNGTDDLIVTNVSSNNALFKVVGSTSFTIPKNKIQNMKLVFTPLTAGSSTAQLAIVSNDPGTPTTNIQIAATSALAPVITTTPDSLSFTVKEKDSTTASLTIGNTGAGPLQWSVDEFGSSSLSEIMVTLPARKIQGASYENGFMISGGTLPEQTVALGNLKGKRIAFTRIPFTLTDDLRLRGASVSQLFSPISNTVLDTLDVIAIDDAIGSYTANDISLLRLWVQKGRSILVQGDDQGSMNNINALISGTGIFEKSLGTYLLGMFTKITPHQITAGVDTVRSSAYGAYSDITPPAYVLVRDDTNRSHIAISNLGSGRVMVAGNEITEDFNFTPGDTRLMMNQAFDWLAGGGQFTSVTPSSGVISSGGSQIVTVKANAKSTFPGLYQSTISLKNNDPLRNPKNVRVSMRVIGRPVISVVPDTLKYGFAHVGVKRIDSLQIQNIGTEKLEVNNITASDTSFKLSNTSFTVPPGLFGTLFISYTPKDTGLFSSAILISSNDSGRLSVKIPLFGRTIQPPVISVSPDSFAFVLKEKDSTTAQFTITNSGLGKLTWSYGSDGAVTSLADVIHQMNEEKYPLQSRSEEKRNSNDKVVFGASPLVPEQITASKVLVIKDSQPWGIPSLDLVLAQLKIVPTIINSSSIASTNLSSYELIIVASEQPFSFNQTIIAQMGKLESYVQGGGKLEFHYCTNNYIDLTFPGGVKSINKLSSIDIVANPLHPISNKIPRVLNGSLASHVQFSNIPVGAIVITKDSVNQNPTTVEYSFGAGRILLTGMTWEYYYNTIGPSEPIGRMLTNAVLYMSSGIFEQFITLSPTNGIVQPSGNQIVNMKINTRTVSPGQFKTDISLKTDDPLRNPKKIPVSLRVIGKPIISVLPDSFSFRSAYVGVKNTDSLLIKNIGSETLIITSISVADTAFKINTASMNIPSGGEQKLLVSFIPKDTLQYKTLLTFISNDSGKLKYITSVMLRAIHPPSIVTSPDSFMVRMMEKDSLTRVLNITNNGLGVLTWNYLDYQNALVTQAEERFDYLFSPTSLWKRWTDEDQQTVEQSSRLKPISAMHDERIKEQIATVNGPSNTAIVDFPIFGTTSMYINKINPNSGDTLRYLNMQMSGYNEGLAFDGKYLYIYNAYYPRLYKIEYSTRKIVDSVSSLPSNNMSGLATDGKVLYMFENTNQRILAYNMATRTVVGQLKFDSISVMGGGLAYSGKRKSFFLSVFGTAIWEIDMTTGKRLNSFSVPNFNTVYGLGYSSSTDILVASTFTATYLLNPLNGSVISSFNGGYLSIACDEVFSGFISMQPVSGIVQPKSSQQVSIKYNAKNLTKGTYSFLLNLSSNDPLKPIKVLPITAIIDPLLSVEGESNIIPKEFALHQNYPNPFNPATTIKFDLPKNSKVNITLYNILGERVAELVNEEKPAGYYSIKWNGSTHHGMAASGVYFATLRAGDYVKTLKMILLK